MKTVEEIRLENLKTLISEAGTIAKLAEDAKTDPSYLSQIMNRTTSRTDKPRDVGTELARKLEEAGKKQRGWMDHDWSENAKSKILDAIANDKYAMHVAEEILAMEEPAKYQAQEMINILKKKPVGNNEDYGNNGHEDGKRPITN